MLYRLISYIKFWFTASDQHGVHSPFIYNFVTQCLYKPSKYNTSRSMDILLKTADYFDIQEMLLVGDAKKLEKQLVGNTIIIKDSTSTFHYLESLNQVTVNTYMTGISGTTNGTIIYVPEIYRNRERTNFWQILKQWEATTVSVDMFYGGLLFIGRPQAKEHFKIRA